jgi:hypothetical protein
VNTASSAQVRRPLYKTSLQRWQPQRALLQPLLEGLGPELAPACHHEADEVAASGTERRS